MANKIHVNVYRCDGKQPFKVEQPWSVGEPSIEFESKKHGDLAINFRDDGTIEIIYWSPRIPITAENVRPASLILQP